MISPHAPPKVPGEVKAVLDALLATSGHWDKKRNWFNEHNVGVAALPLNIAARRCS